VTSHAMTIGVILVLAGAACYFTLLPYMTGGEE